jgi:tRNA dimethylallyltransferase
VALKKIIAIVGPTASGKSSLAMELAVRLSNDGGAGDNAGVEIVSADSRQIYRGMDIGTAKPSLAERTAVAHHLIDIRNPDEDYSVADYKSDAVAAINNILARGKTPLLVGGTGLYVQAVVENLDMPKIKSDPALRGQIEKEIAEKGLPAVFQKLLALDPDAEYVVDGKNPRRVVRALEVAFTTGKPFTAQRLKQPPLFDSFTIGLNPPQEILYERIDTRVDAMIEKGLVDEVRTLIKKYGEAQIAFDTIGYREIIDHLNGHGTLEEAVQNIKMNTRHYAKRQMTWFKKDMNVKWIAETVQTTEAIALVKNFLAPQK